MRLNLPPTHLVFSQTHVQTNTDIYLFTQAIKAQLSKP